MEIVCPSCKGLLQIPDNLDDGRHLQCTECNVKFVINNGAATLLPACECPRAIVCDAKPPRRAKATFYPLSSEWERRNYAWRRWTARAIDFYFGFAFVFALYFVLGILFGITGIGLDFWDWIAQPQNVWADYVMTTFFAYFSSVIVYVLFGTTLGKKMCGLLVADEVGNRLSGLAYLIRECRVIFYGEWLCIPLLTLFGLNRQFKKVIESGRASYDNNWSKQNFYSRPTRGRKVIDTFFIVMVVILGAVMRGLLER